MLYEISTRIKPFIRKQASDSIEHRKPGSPSLVGCRPAKPVAHMRRAGSNPTPGVDSRNRLVEELF